MPSHQENLISLFKENYLDNILFFLSSLIV